MHLESIMIGGQKYESVRVVKLSPVNNYPRVPVHAVLTIDIFTDYEGSKWIEDLSMDDGFTPIGLIESDLNKNGVAAITKYTRLPNGNPDELELLLINFYGGW